MKCATKPKRVTVELTECPTGVGEKKKRRGCFSQWRSDESSVGGGVFIYNRVDEESGFIK